MRPSGEPHLAPLWFAFEHGCFYLCTAPASAKARNLEADGRVVLALEDGRHPLICQGHGQAERRPWPSDVVAAFRHKYDWRIETDRTYTRLIRIRPLRWLTW